MCHTASLDSLGISVCDSVWLWLQFLLWVASAACWLLIAVAGVYSPHDFAKPVSCPVADRQMATKANRTESISWSINQTHQIGQEIGFLKQMPMVSSTSHYDHRPIHPATRASPPLQSLRGFHLKTVEIIQLAHCGILRKIDKPSNTMPNYQTKHDHWMWTLAGSAFNWDSFAWKAPPPIVHIVVVVIN